MRKRYFTNVGANDDRINGESKAGYVIWLAGRTVHVEYGGINVPPGRAGRNTKPRWLDKRGPFLHPFGTKDEAEKYMAGRIALRKRNGYTERPTRILAPR